MSHHYHEDRHPKNYVDLQPKKIIQDTKPPRNPLAPDYYQVLPGWDVIAVSDALGFGLSMGNVLKYIVRAGRKDPTKEIEDLEKAQECLSRHIATLKARK